MEINELASSRSSLALGSFILKAYNLKCSPHASLMRLRIFRLDLFCVSGMISLCLGPEPPDHEQSFSLITLVVCLLFEERKKIIGIRLTALS